MKTHRLNTHRLNTDQLKALAKAVVMTVLTVSGASGVQADKLDSVFQVGQAKTRDAQKSQQKIDKLADETRDRLQDYKQVLKQSEGLKVYISRLDKQIADQDRRIQEIEDSIVQVTVVQRQMPALIERMIESLGAFVALDYPFYLEEREQRLEFLRANLSRSDLTVAEKFRQVMEAYKIENEYGRKISTYKGTVEIESGSEREVTLLQIGRIALMYQTTDTKISGAWDPEAKAWVQLDSGQYKNAIRQAIRIADNQATKDILTVPVAAPEAVNQ
jgi:hypothetical protein